MRFKLTLCTNWSRVFSPEAGELQKVGLGCFCAIERPSPFVSSTLPPTETRDVRSIDRGGSQVLRRRQVRLQNRSILISRNRIDHNSSSPGRHSWRAGGGARARAGLMLSAAATPVAGRASHFAAQSQSHRQGRRPPPSEWSGRRGGAVATPRDPTGDRTSWFAFTCLDFTIAL